MNTVCIYCKQQTKLNKEHVFPKSLLQKNTPAWVSNKILCAPCNSKLGAIDNALSKRSHIAFMWDTIQMELGIGNLEGHASIFHKRASGVNPVRIPFPDPLYDDLIVLHERSSQDSHMIDFVKGFSALRPQMILTQYPEGQTNRNIVKENSNRFYSSSKDNISDYDPEVDVFCFFNNTHVFPPEATWHFVKNINEFKSKYITDHPRTRYDLRVIFPEDVNSWNIFYDFHNALEGKSKEIIEEDKSLTTSVFQGRIQVVPDPGAEQMIARSIAKVAFHCFLYHYSEYTGHEPRLDRIKDFIYEGNGTPTDFVMSAKDIELEDLVYNSTEHRHYLRFFVKGENIGCQIDFFTGLLPNAFSYNVILAGDPDNTHPICDRVEYIPFSVHSKSPIKKRILPITDLGLIYRPHRNNGLLWYP